MINLSKLTSLLQRDLSIAEYMNKFQDLLVFMDGVTLFEAAMVGQFQDELSPKFKGLVKV